VAEPAPGYQHAFSRPAGSAWARRLRCLLTVVICGVRPTAARPLRAGVLVLLIATACSTRSSAPSPSPAHPSLSVARDEQARPGPRRDPPSLAAAEPATVPVVRTGQLRDQPVTAAQVPVVPMSPVYDVGDSLTVGAQPYLQEDIAGIAVNGRVGR